MKYIFMCYKLINPGKLLYVGENTLGTGVVIHLIYYEFMISQWI